MNRWIGIVLGAIAITGIRQQATPIIAQARPTIASEQSTLTQRVSIQQAFEAKAIQQTTGIKVDTDVDSIQTNVSLEFVRSQLSDLKQFPLFLPPSQGTITAAHDQLSSTQLSEPSFSWIRDQVSNRLGSATLIEQWQAYRTTDGLQYVDVIVNENQWNQLRYFSQYGFILQFGTVAQNNRYQLRVFHSRDASNRNDAIAIEASDNTAISERSVLLRGSYFCEVNVATTQALDCSAFVAL